MPDIFDQVTATATATPSIATAPRVRGRTVGDIFDQVVGHAPPQDSAMVRFLHGLGVPTNQQEMAATARHLSPSGIIDNVRAGNYGGAAAGLAGPVGTAAYDLLHTVGSELGDQAGQAADAALHGEYGSALKHSLGAAVPLIGPPLAEGNVAGAAGRATGIAAPLVAGRVLGGRVVTPEDATAAMSTTADPNTPFYGDEGARGPLDTTPPKPVPPPPTKMQQIAKAVKTGAGIVRHPILSGATKAAEIVADRLAPTATAGRALPSPSTPDAVAGLQLAGDAPMEPPPPPTMAGVPTAAQIANARASIAKQQTLLTPLDTDALPQSQMQSTSAITPTAPPTTTPTSSRQIALENAVNDYAPPTEPQIPAPRPIARKTAQLEINGEPVGTRVPYASQLPDPTPTIESARALAEQRLARQQARQQATLAIARDTMKSESYPQWALEDQKDFGKAVNADDPGAAAAISSRAAQQTAGVNDPAFGAIHRLPVSSVIEAYRGNGIYIDPDGKFTQIDPQADVAVDSDSNDR